MGQLRFAWAVALVALVSVGCPKGDQKNGGAAGPAASPANAEPAGSAPIIVGRRVDIVVNEKGFEPSLVTIKKDEETTLVFTRTSKNTCADAVVFPELKIDKMLPLNQAVAIVVPVKEPHTYVFQCGMGMYKSKVIVQ